MTKTILFCQAGPIRPKGLNRSDRVRPFEKEQAHYGTLSTNGGMETVHNIVSESIGQSTTATSSLDYGVNAQLTAYLAISPALDLTQFIKQFSI